MHRPLCTHLPQWNTRERRRCGRARLLAAAASSRRQNFVGVTFPQSQTKQQGSPGARRAWTMARPMRKRASFMIRRATSKERAGAVEID